MKLTAYVIHILPRLSLHGHFPPLPHVSSRFLVKHADISTIYAKRYRNDVCLRYLPITSARNGNLEVPVYYLKRNSDMPSEK
jgi:hypothetical protein